METMKQIFDLSTPAKLFRFFAIWEAITWMALLVAMFFKWVLGHEEAVAIPGMVHGVAGFIPFIVVSLYAAWKLQWPLKVTVLALISSVPPLGSIVFEWWAARNGLLAELSTAPRPAEGLAA